MKELSDMQLVDAYASKRSEDAFRELVARHIDLIYSVALRQLRNPQLAEEATQSAFIALAGKAHRLRRTTIIAGWLHRAVHYAALNLQRGEIRRKYWEEEAASMNVSNDADHAFQELALPHVDGALAELSESDRDAVILRFLKQQSFRDLAQTLGTSEEAAKKRVSRALERLRGLLAQRGVAVSSVAIASGLSQLPVTTAPSGLSSSLAALAVSTAPPSVSIYTSMLALVATEKARFAIGAGLVILAGAAIFAWLHHTSRKILAVSPNPMTTSSTPKINLTSVIVDDQDKALKFYTEILGFVKKNDVPTGEPGGARWLTVVSPAEPDGSELLLEPMGWAFVRTYQKALFDAGRPWVAFGTADIQGQFERLKSLGVKFSVTPTASAPSSAMFEDTCGNRIQIFQAPASGNTPAPTALRIKLNSVMVDEQSQALKFYTDVMGFVKKTDKPSAADRWLTVVSPEERDGTELRLEATSFSPARTFQQALHKAGIPFTQFEVADVRKTHERMTRLGVAFHTHPTEMGPVIISVFDDTCGNLILLLQKKD